MVIFHSYVSLPEGRLNLSHFSPPFHHPFTTLSVARIPHLLRPAGASLAQRLCGSVGAAADPGQAAAASGEPTWGDCASATGAAIGQNFPGFSEETSIQLKGIPIETSI